MVNLTEDELSRFVTSIRSGEYNLLLGAGVSLKSLGGNGMDLPTGEGLRVELCTLKGARAGASLQRVFELLSGSEVKHLITDRFSSCIPGPSILRIPTLPWRRIFTLNIDDAVEKAYSDPSALQELVVRNYKDPYEDSRELTEVPIIHLHGFSGKPNDGYVFSRSAYVGQITRNNSWLTVLADFLAVEPFVIIGTSLDEVDLDFYLAQRSHASARLDVGPSFFIEPYPDAVFLNDCEKHNLLPFEGTADQFFDFVDATVGERKSPIELIAAPAKAVFPSATDPKSVAKFLADFEIVPRTVDENAGDPRFMLGHEPTWSDLQSGLDVSRDVTASISRLIEGAFKSPMSQPQIIFYPDDPGAGKSTLIRRVAYDFSRRGTRTLLCSTLGRLEPAFTASMLDLIDDPLLVVVDNFADQAGPIADIAGLMEKVDAIFLCSERSYRNRYINQSLAGTFSTIAASRSLTAREVEALISNYVSAGWVGASQATENPKKFAKELSRDPIAVACCRILNDFSPMDRIVNSIWEASRKIEKDRYLAASLAQYCINGGIRYDILVKVAGGYGLSEQIRTDHTLPLAYSEGSGRSYIVPLNGIIGGQVLERAAREDPALMFRTFVEMAKAIAPRVNRRTIKRRSPEARLAGRLFDFDQVVEKFLGDRAANFYSDVQEAWQWNSRYWEQVALLHLAKFYKSPETEEGQSHLETARQHARHAVSVEDHPFALTTLGKILFAQAQSVRGLRQSAFDEAFGRIAEAIDMERNWAWTNSQAFVILFRGVRDLLDLGVRLNSSQAEGIVEYSRYARRRFARDRELMDTIDQVQSRI
ncbi:hypothetical protein BH10PSE14_BH10PSE14_10420 [soil metagenome]